MRQYVPHAAGALSAAALSLLGPVDCDTASTKRQHMEETKRSAHFYINRSSPRSLRVKSQQGSDDRKTQRPWFDAEQKQATDVQGVGGEKTPHDSRLRAHAHAVEIQKDKEIAVSGSKRHPERDSKYFSTTTQHQPAQIAVRRHVKTEPDWRERSTTWEEKP